MKTVHSIHSTMNIKMNCNYLISINWFWIFFACGFRVACSFLYVCVFLQKSLKLWTEVPEHWS